MRRALLDWRVILVVGLVALAPGPIVLFEAGDSLPVPTVAVGLGIPLALLTLVAGVALLRETPRNGAGLVFAGWSFGIAIITILVGLGRVGFDLAAALLVFFGLFPATALLLHPSGRLPDAITRRLFIPLGAAVAVAGAAVIAASPVLPGGAVARFCQYSACGNPLALTDDPSLTGPATRLFLALTIALLLLAAWGVVQQVHAASPADTRTVLPAAISGAAWVAMAIMGAAVQIPTVFASAAPWIQPTQTFLAALVPVGALLGVAMRARGRREVVPRILEATERAQAITDVERALRHAMNDPGIRVIPGAPRTAADPAYITVPLRSGDGAAVGALRVAPDTYRAHADDIQVVLPALALAMEREALAGRITNLDQALAGMREAAQQTRADERQAIARDLHDGVQQQLIALRFRLGALEALIDRDPDGARSTLDDLATEAEIALATIRDLGRGAGPAGLRDLGLEGALRADMARLPLAVHLDLRDVADLPASTQRAAYFICLEGVQNALKHRGPAARCDVRVACRGRVLVFDIVTHGAGATAIHPGEVPVPRTIAQRVASAGGTVAAEVDRDGSHLVTGAIPLAAPGSGERERAS